MGSDRLTMDAQVAFKAGEAGASYESASLALPLVLYRAVTAFERAHANELASTKLSVSQFNVLNVLHRAEEPVTMGDLAEAVSVRQASLTAVVDSLVRADLVTRRENPRDRRSVLVGISQEGERFLDGFLPGHWEFLEDVFSGLRANDRAHLVSLLSQLIASLQSRG